MSALASPAISKTTPNIVYILADDLGYGDLTCYNKDSKIPTPNLDRLAAQGVRFTDAHAPSALCTPTRYALLTGRYAWRTALHGVLFPWGTPLIDAQRLTAPQLLKNHGYSTACIGKWHLGFDWPTKDGQPATFNPDRPCNVDFTKPIANGPTTRGFDYYFGVDVPNFPPFCYIENDRTVGQPIDPESIANFIKMTTKHRDRFPGNWHTNMLPVGAHTCLWVGPILSDWNWEDIQPELGRRAEAFIERASKDPSRKPFFLYFSLTGPHSPVVPTKEFISKSKAGDHGDFVVQIDAMIGQLMETLERAGVAENTIVIFTSDNGPDTCDSQWGAYNRALMFGHYSMGPLRGVKRDTWEGGHRVPFIVRWPAKIKPGGVSDEVISHVDFIATCAALLDAKLPENMAEDSYNVLPALLGEPHEKPIRPAMVLNSSMGDYAIRGGDWIYIDAPTGDSTLLANMPGGGEPVWLKRERGYTHDLTPGLLYNLKEDISQRHNLYAEHPEKVKELKALLEKYKTEGRSTPGAPQKNDVEILQRRYRLISE